MPASLDTFRAAVARIEGHASSAKVEAISLFPAIDRMLPGHGLARAAFHEILAADTPGQPSGSVTSCLCARLVPRSALQLIPISGQRVTRLSDFPRLTSFSWVPPGSGQPLGL